MNVLITADKGESPFTDELCKAFSENFQVELSVENFWTRKKNYDIIHIHWPELLTHWQSPTKYELLFLKDVLLPYWQSKAKIIITRHNIYPHYRDTEHFRNLYTLIYSFADSVVHMGEYCFEEFSLRYKELENLNRIKRRIIPHHIFYSYPNERKNTDNRKELFIQEKDKVILFPGKLRSKEEADLLFQMFRKLKVKYKKLIVFRWWDFTNEPPKKEIKRWIKWKLRVWFVKLHPAYCMKYEFVPNEDIQLYVNASDLLVIPRKEILNSGIAFLAFAFEKPVVGPESGNLTNVLHLTKNVSFKTNSVRAFTEAVQKALELSYAGKGVESAEIARKTMSIDKVISQYEQLYQELYLK